MKINPEFDQGYKLLHEGTIALSQVEANGIKIDVPYLERAIARTTDQIKLKRSDLLKTDVWRAWQKRYGAKANLDSREQLGELLFSPKHQGGLGYKGTLTESEDRYATDATALSDLGIPFIADYLEVQSLDKALTTNLKAILREVDAFGYLHPVFNLNTVSTYRSSSDTPNFQNFPTRNPKLGKLVRRAFIARKGRVLVENDFKGIEVGVAACYHKDPVMISYIKDETKDMHRDMAMQLYIFTPKEWARLEKKNAKAIRHAAKNKFVFPQFYGDWWKTCAENLWNEISRTGLKGPDGEDLREWLKSKGITGLGVLVYDEKGHIKDPKKGTFYYHVKEVENDFWNNRFKVYGKWKKKWFSQYLERGYFDTYTGFRIGGKLDKNQVINFPVQGSAFHCLLWSLIEIQRELRRRKMQTKIVGQIHDSIIADVPVEELDDYLEIVNDVTTRRLSEHWNWIIVPLQVECEIVPQGMTWHDKREVKMTSGERGTVYKVEGYEGTARGLIQFWNDQPKAA